MIDQSIITQQDRVLAPAEDKPHSFLGEELSEEEHREVCANLAAFFLILKGWRDKHGEA